MSLLTEINGNLLINLSQGSSNQSTPASSSSLTGKGKGASFDKPKIDVRSGLSRALTSFSNSFVRINKAVISAEFSIGILTKVQSFVESLQQKAKIAADLQTTAEQRSKLDSQFRSDVQQIEKIFDQSVRDSTDFLDKSDIRNLLIDSGVDPNAATKLTEAFERIGGSDSRLGYEKVTLEDGTLVDPLSLTIDTQVNAAKAEKVYKNFAEEIKQDLEGMKVVSSELKGAFEFAAEGANAFQSAIDSYNPSTAPEEIALSIVGQIKRKTSDQNLSGHSNIDSVLAKELLV